MPAATTPPNSQRELARQDLLRHHLGLVHHVARQVASRLRGEVELDELVSAGTLGLMQAASAFEPSRGHSFSTFAVPRIRGAILDELRRQDSIPRSARRRAREIAQARAELERKIGRSATSDELALCLGVGTEVLRRWESATARGVHVSLDRAANDDAGRVVPSELFANAESTSVEDRLTHEQEVVLMQAAIGELSDRERNVLALCYFEELTLQEVGAVLGLSACRISQIRSAALQKLRVRLAPLRAA